MNGTPSITSPHPSPWKGLPGRLLDENGTQKFLRSKNLTELNKHGVLAQTGLRFYLAVQTVNIAFRSGFHIEKLQTLISISFQRCTVRQ